MTDHAAEQLSHAIGRGLKDLADAVRHASSTQLILNRIDQLESKIMATQKEIADGLQTVVTQLKKLDNDTKVLQGSVDTLQKKIVDLEAIINAGGDASPELVQAFNDVKAAVQTVDDNVPEVTVPPPIV
jgi:chromosome segregation ATPase